MPTHHLIDSLSTTQPLARLFSDRSVLQAMLDFEVALARVEASLGLIPREAVPAIEASARAEHFDAERIAEEARAGATVSIPVIRALTAHVRALDRDSAAYVHWGATSQDVADTALVLMLRQARAIVAADHAQASLALRRLSDQHADTVMLGRTLLQAAPPITFGLKAAGWVSALDRGWSRLDAAFDDALILQLGGASGTLAVFGDRGLDVVQALARALQLRAPAAPWHTDRDRLAAVVTAAGVYTGTVGKVARDLALLMQEEIGETTEPGGGSSSMPQKRNPAASTIAVAAATRVPGLVAAFLGGMLQEHERGAGGLQAEWPTVAAVVEGTGAAVAALAAAVTALSVHPERMRSNIERTNGTIFAERVMTLAAPAIGKEAATALVTRALALSRESGQPFREALSSLPDAVAALGAAQLKTIDVAEDYLGVAEQLRRQLLAT